MSELKHGSWKLSDLETVEKNGSKVFSFFSCAGGSTMGYKLAGYDVIGCCEIDKKMMAIYKANHSPKHAYEMDIRDFNKIPDSELPKELFDLDILDGSPPCSSFSMSGARERKWGKKNKFREGQVEQVLDDLFFNFIDTAEKLNPKIIVTENVKGLITGKAKGYVKQILRRFKDAGYETQFFLLNAAAMGVPQSRPRVFFISNRMDYPKIKMEFNERQISVMEAFKGITTKGRDTSHSPNYKYWKMCKPGDSFAKYHPRQMLFNWSVIPKDKPIPTLTSNCHAMCHYETMRLLSTDELLALQTFPADFNLLEANEQSIRHVCGMSVPPFMMQRIVDQIHKQWLLKS